MKKIIENFRIWLIHKLGGRTTTEANIDGFLLFRKGRVRAYRDVKAFIEERYGKDWMDELYIEVSSKTQFMNFFNSDEKE